MTDWADSDSLPLGYRIGSTRTLAEARENARKQAAKYRHACETYNTAVFNASDLRLLIEVVDDLMRFTEVAAPTSVADGQ